MRCDNEKEKFPKEVVNMPIIQNIGVISIMDFLKGISIILLLMGEQYLMV